MRIIAQFAFNNVMRNKKCNATRNAWFNRIQNNPSEIRNEIDYVFQYSKLPQKIKLLLGKF